MTIRMEDIGAPLYGGAVTWSEWWDNKRIDEGKIGTKDIWKKASFYTYLGIGLTATLMSVFNWMPQFRIWEEKISTGFFYDLPRFATNLFTTFSAGSRVQGESAAVREANRIVSERRQLAQGQGRSTSRSYQREFESVAQAF